MKKDTIKILLLAGFTERGKNQYVHPKKGRLFLETYEAPELVEKLMKLGAEHKCHEIKKSLHISEDFLFQPSA